MGNCLKLPVVTLVCKNYRQIVMIFTCRNALLVNVQCCDPAFNMFNMLNMFKTL